MPTIIKLKCKRCKGEGEIPSIQPDPLGGPYDPLMIPCHRCDGEGYKEEGLIEGDLIDTINDILDKCNDIFEKVNEP